MKYLPDPAASELLLWTYKEGLLSRAAHDLCLRPGRWEAPLEVEGEAFSVQVRLPVRELRVQGQVKRGRVVPLKDKDHREIEGNLRDTVLDAGRHPELTFAGRGERSGGRVALRGELCLRGATRPLSVASAVVEEEEALRVTGEVRFAQTRFGIKPFSALLGALKVQDEVRVSWSLLYRPA